MPRRAPAALLLVAILAGAFWMRAVCLGWGLPPSIPHAVASELRCSYSFDEDDLLTHVSFMEPSKLNFDARLYHWGTLHFELTLGWLEGAQALGVFGHPWRQAYYQMIPGDFEKVYGAARLLPVVMSILSIWLAYLFGAEFAGERTGLWTALLVAVSPAHLLSSTQARVDATMLAAVTLAAWLGLRVQKQPRAKIWFALGLASGLAVVAKYPAALLVAPIAIAALWPPRFASRAVLLVLAGGVLGCLIGQPYAMVKLDAMIEQLRLLRQAGANVPPEFRITASDLFRQHALFIVRFLIGPVAAGLALAGLWRLARQRNACAWLPIGALAGAVATLVLLQWPLLRYELPMLPFLTLAAAVTLEACPAALRALAGVAAVMLPLAASFTQISYMRQTHPANQALPVILEAVPPGTVVSRMTPEMPPLDRKVYPMGPSPLLSDLTRDPPPWILLDRLPMFDYPASTWELVTARYDKVAEFHVRRLFPWATFGEDGSPHDWRYTNASMSLYRRRDGR